MTQEELDIVLKDHALWVNSGGEEGRLADFTDEDLSRLNMRRMNLEAAIFRRARLENADLEGAHLEKACFEQAILSGANLQGACCRFADFESAIMYSTQLQGANLTGARMRMTRLDGANMTGAELHAVMLKGASLTGVDLSEIDLEVPIIPNLESSILAALDQGGQLDMLHWHRCGTVHCRAGWAITLAGEAGKALEKSLGSSGAGAFIYFKSTGYVPDFFSSSKEALEDIRERAALEAAL